MLNDRKKIGFIIIAIGIIFLLVIIYFGFIKTDNIKIQIPEKNNSSGKLPVENKINTTTPGDKVRNYQKYDISEEKTHETNEEDLQKLAMSFAERFGSYSNQSNYNNFVDLEIFMTSNMRAWANKYVEKLKLEDKDKTNYFGVSTKALFAKTKSFNKNNGTAEMTITTQRQESTVDINNNKTYTQNIDIFLVENNGSWLVDKAYWQR